MTAVTLFGSTGFIGSAYLEHSTNQVESVDRNLPNPNFNEIVYAIGTTDNYNIFENPYLDIETNLIKLISDLELIRKKFGNFTINYLSSWFVYGDANFPPFREDGYCNPKGFYSISKFAAEKFLISYCETYEINYRILRLANVFGSTDSGVSKKKNALQFLLSEIKQNRNIELYEGGDFVRDYIDVRDVVSAIDLLIEKGEANSIYNIGTGIPTRFYDLLHKAKLATNSSSEFVNIPTPKFHRIVQVRDSFLEVSKLKSLGFSPKYSILNEIIHL